MSFGKNVRIFLVDGNSTGIKHAEIVNWTGQGIMCPRARIAELFKWPESKRPGVYFLFGTDEENRPAVYIGEAENVCDRLQEHSSKEFWNEVVFFTNKDENLTKAHVKFLEHKLVHLASEAKRFIIKNGNTPPLPSIPISDRDSMSEFIEYMRILLGVLGFRVLDPFVGVEKKESTEKPNLKLQKVKIFIKIRKIKAEGLRTDEGVVVLAGSDASLKTQKSISQGYIKLRDSLIKSKILIQEGDYLKFAEDYLFTSLSAAACIVVGYSINGRNVWKNAEGRSLGEVER